MIPLIWEGEILLTFMWQWEVKEGEADLKSLQHDNAKGIRLQFRSKETQMRGGLVLAAGPLPPQGNKETHKTTMPMGVTPQGTAASD